jgi:hypothetical protein
MLPVSLDCPFLLPFRYSLTCICPVSCAPYVASFSGLSIFDCPFGILQHLFVLCLLYPMVPVSLDCPFSLPLRYSLTFICPVSRVPYVASFSGLSFLLPFRYSLTCICPVSCAPYVASFSGLSFLLPFRYSLTCICPVSSAPYFASFSGLSFFITLSVFSNMYLSCVLCTLCCQFLWIFHF